MSDGIIGVIPTVVGAGVALKAIDVAFPKGKSKRRKNMKMSYGKPKVKSAIDAFGRKSRTFKKTKRFEKKAWSITGVTEIAARGKKHKAMSVMRAAGV